MKITIAIGMIGMLSSLSLHAQTPSSDFSISGYLDFYYSYDFFDPGGQQRQYVTQAARHNEFNLNLGLVQADYQSDRVRATLALQTGTYPVTNYGAEPNPLARLIQTASIGIKLSENTWIEAGVLGGHFGYEGVRSMDNELYTQALATEYTPYYQTGIQLSSRLSDQLTLRAVVVNGWQNIYETNQSKSTGIGIDYTPNQNWTISYGNYLGKDPVGGQDRLRFHNNFYLSYASDTYGTTMVIDYMLEGLNYDLPMNTNVLFITWIHQYTLSDKWKVAGRYEYVEDPASVLLASPTGRFQTQIVTVALRHYITPRSLFSLEFKQYFGNENIWINASNANSSNNSVVTAGLTVRIP